MRDIDVIDSMSLLQQKAYDEFTVEHFESEGKPIGVIGTRFVRYVFDGRYGADLRDKDKPKTYMQQMEEIQSLKAMIVEMRDQFKLVNEILEDYRSDTSKGWDLIGVIETQKRFIDKNENIRVGE